MERTILHCDCNSFFASVETALEPSYKNVPMAVCGSEEARHGIVLAKNELAKAYGIETAETVHSAKRKCPALVIASPHYDMYVKYSKKVNAIYLEYTDLVEPFGIDESWLDVTASRRIFGNGIDIAEQIRKRVKDEIGITISVGVSFNKVFAKLGSDYKKPDAVTLISRENYKDIVYPLPVKDLLFVGKRTTLELHKLGIRTIGELAEAEHSTIISRLGKTGEMLCKYALGEDDSPVRPDSRDEAKSISNGFTFKHDLISKEDIRLGLDFLCEEIGQKLRRKCIKCNTVVLSVKDIYLRTTQRQRRLNTPTDVSRVIANTAFSIMKDEWSLDKPIRSLTVSVSGFSNAGAAFEQLDLFSSPSEESNSRGRIREETVDSIRQRFGFSSIGSGAMLGSDIGIIKDDDE